MANPTLVKIIVDPLLYLITAVLVIIAVMISAVRLHPDINHIVQDQVEKHLSQSLNAQVSINELQLGSNHPFSELIAQGVSIKPASSDAHAWSLDSVAIELDLLASLFSRTLKLKKISLAGLDFSLHRDQQGQIYLNRQFPLLATKDSQRNQLQFDHVSILRSKILWSDEITGVQYQFTDVSASFATGLVHTDVSFYAQLPEQLGNTIHLQVRIDSDWSNLQEAKIKFYADIQNLYVAEISYYLPSDYQFQSQAVLALQAWGEYDQGQLKTSQGSIDLMHLQAQDSSPNPTLCLTEQMIQGVSLDYQLSKRDKHWQLLADNIDTRYNVMSADNAPKQKLALTMSADSSQSRSVSLYINTVNLGAVCNSLHGYQSSSVQQALTHLRADANLNNLTVHIQQGNDQITAIQYAAEFDAATLWQVSSDQKITGLSGSITGTDLGATISLASERVKLTMPELYPTENPELSLHGNLRWQRQADKHLLQTELVRIENSDLVIDARFMTMIDHGQLYTDAQLFIERATAAELDRYLPALKQISRTKSWFADAIQQGEVVASRVLLRGQLKDFPYHKHSGVLSADVTLRDALIEYKNNWPAFSDVQAKINLDKDHVMVIPSHGMMYDSQLTQARLEIPSFLKAVLYADGQLLGGGQNLIQFLADSGLVARQNSVADQISLQGSTRLNLSFIKSLSTKVALPFTLSGQLDFEDNTLNVHAADISLTDLTGTLSFDQDGAYGDHLSAKLYGHKLALNAEALGAGASKLFFQGKFDLDAYLSSQQPQLKPFAHGQTAMQGWLYLPSMFKQNNPEKLILKATSQLTGIEFNLPHPLNKPSTESYASELLFDQKQSTMRLQLAQRAGLLFHMSEAQPFELRLIEFGLPTSEQSMVAEELKLVGTIDRLPIESWLATYQQYNAELVRRGITTDNSSLPRLDLFIESLDWSPWPTQEINLQASMLNNNYEINMRSSLGTGRVVWPQLEDDPIIFDLEEFRVHHNDEKSVQVLRPTQLPAFVFNAKRFHLKDKLIKDVGINTMSIHDGLFFNQVNFALEDLQAQGQGSWRQTESGDTWSEFSFDINISDLADALESLNYETGLRNGKGSIKTQLSWPDAPHKVTLANMAGRTTIDIRDGSITEVEPGAGRLLALLNLSALTRRLSLDFKDVTAKGFTFNSITGDLDLKVGGEMKMENVIIDSSAALIEFTGTTNIVDRTYDQNIFVTPSVTDSLPAAGALVGGPIGAAAGYVVDKVAKVVGLDRALNYQYTMTGTWEQPEIVKLKKVSDGTSVDDTATQ